MIGLDWFAAGLTLLGIELTRRHYWQGFAVGSLNQILWIQIGVNNGLFGLVVMDSILMCQFAFSAYKWWKEGQ